MILFISFCLLLEGSLAVDDNITKFKIFVVVFCASKLAGR